MVCRLEENRPMKSKLMMPLAALLAVVPTFVFAAGESSANTDGKSDIEVMKQQIDDLKKRLDEIQKSGPQRSEEKPTVTVPQTLAAPFSDGDYTWLNGNSRVTDNLIDNDWFTGQFMVDTNYTYDFNHPKDHTLDGSCEVGRTNELQLQQLGIGGDLHYGNIRGRLMTQFGMYSQMTPRNDATPSRGQWQLD